ncbi:VRR-NUC domain-containing protein [Sessilibacter sp. MAH4]
MSPSQANLLTQPLASDYYRRNFLELLDLVERQYDDLFTPQERTFNQHFRKLSFDAQCLLVRLVSRAPTVFRIDKLQYPEIADINAALADLHCHGFVANQSERAATELEPLFSQEELATWLEAQKISDLVSVQGLIPVISKSRQREELATETQGQLGMVAAHPQPEQFSLKKLKRAQLGQLFFEYARAHLTDELLTPLPFETITLICGDWITRLRVMYFGNLRQDLSQFVLRDLQLQEFQSYIIDRENRLFLHSNSINLFIELHNIKTIINAINVDLEIFSVHFEHNEVFVFDSLLHYLSLHLNCWKIFLFFKRWRELAGAEIIQQLELLARAGRDQRPSKSLSHLLWLTLSIIVSIMQRKIREDLSIEQSLAAAKIHRQLISITEKLAYQFERADFLQIALDLYTGIDTAYARERRARIHERLKQTQLALAICQSIKNNASEFDATVSVANNIRSDESELEFAESFGHKLTKKIRYLYWPKPKRYEPPVEIISCVKPEQPRFNSGAEDCVIEYFSGAGSCFFVENYLVLTVFSVVYWDLIYANIPGAFTQPFQHRPHDIFDAEFTSRRRAVKQAIENELLTAEFIDYSSFFEKYSAVQVLKQPLIDLRFVDNRCLELALTRIKTEDWLSLFNRLWGNLNEHRRGMPDLICFPTLESPENTYCFIEVKAPNDKLQDHQRRWLKYFSQKNIPHKLIQVQWVAND